MDEFNFCMECLRALPLEDFDGHQNAGQESDSDEAVCNECWDGLES